MGPMADAIANEHFERAEDLFAVLSAVEQRWMPDLRAWMFRGQADPWPLVPPCLRIDDTTKMPVWHRYLGDVGRSMVDEGKAVVVLRAFLSSRL